MIDSQAQRLRRLLEYTCVATLVVVVAWHGFSKLANWNGPAFTLTNELYVPAVMFAHGHGFFNPPVDEVPGLRDFLYLRNGVAQFDGSTIPQQVTAAPMDAYQRYHRYLIYTMGWVWRVAGVSWDNAKLLAVGQYVCCAVLGYALLRLFLSPWLALAGALLFALSPTVANVVFNIRDFSKAPFLMATMALLLYLIREPRPEARLMRVAVLLGLSVGIGLGFRRDLLVAIPPVLLVLGCAPLLGGGLRLKRRAKAVGAFGAMVLLFGWPVFAAFQDEGSLVAHDILMGMGTGLEDEMGLSRAAYERVPVRHDAFVSGLASGLARREEHLAEAGFIPPSQTQGGEASKNHYLAETISLFPADMLLRGYAAVLRVLSGVDNDWLWKGSRWSNHIEHYGWVYAVVCLLVAASSHPSAAFLSLLLLLYFGGITSLQYEFRHAFHLLIVPALCFLLPVHALSKMAWDRIFRGSKEANAATASIFRRLSNLRRFLTGALLVTVLPWLLCLPVQLLHVGRLYDTLTKATTERVPTRTEVVGDWTYFVRETPLQSIPPDPELEQTFFRPVYLMADIDVNRAKAPLHILTEAEDGAHDFSMLVRLWPAGVPDGNHLRYFFNIPEHMSGRNWVRFVGVGLPTSEAAGFRGLYQVTNVEPIGTNVNFALSDGKAWLSYFKRLLLSSNSYRREWLADAAPLVREHLQKAHAAIRNGKLDEAQRLLEETSSWGMFSMERHAALAQICKLRGDAAGRERLLLEGLKENPLDSAMAYEYEELLTEQGAQVDLLAAWQRAAELAPENPIVLRRLATETEKRNAGRVPLPGGNH